MSTLARDPLPPEKPPAPKLAFDLYTGTFCVLMGMVWSVPASWIVGATLDAHILGKPPAAVEGVYKTLMLGCFFVLPIWCLVAWRKYRTLAEAGLWTFVLVLLILYSSLSSMRAPRPIWW